MRKRTDEMVPPMSEDRLLEIGRIEMTEAGWPEDAKAVVTEIWAELREWFDDQADAESSTAASLSLLEEGLRPGDEIVFVDGVRWDFDRVGQEPGSPSWFTYPLSSIAYPHSDLYPLLKAAIAGGQASIVRNGDADE